MALIVSIAVALSYNFIIVYEFISRNGQDVDNLSSSPPSPMRSALDAGSPDWQIGTWCMAGAPVALSNLGETDGHALEPRELLQGQELRMDGIELDEQQSKTVRILAEIHGTFLLDSDLGTDVHVIALGGSSYRFLMLFRDDFRFDGAVRLVAAFGAILKTNERWSNYALLPSQEVARERQPLFPASVQVRTLATRYSKAGEAIFAIGICRDVDALGELLDTDLSPRNDSHTSVSRRVATVSLDGKQVRLEILSQVESAAYVIASVF